MKKRILSMLLVMCMVFTTMPATVFAAETVTPIGVSSVTDGKTVCENHKEHDDSCGYNEAVEGADCTHECELCKPPKQDDIVTGTCICDTLCTEGVINPDCPACGIEGSDLSECRGMALTLQPMAALAGSSTSGTCGAEGNEANVTWNLSGGTLTISGTGDMADYIGYDGTWVLNYPWKEYQRQITTVKIDSGITSIGNNAFSSCSGITSVTFTGTSNLKRIGESAFSSCTRLTTFVIPDSVTTIGAVAFYNNGLTSIIIPDSVTSLARYTFQFCTKLTSVTLGSGLTSIENGTFYACETLNNVIIPAGITSIGEDAFYRCNSLTSVIMKSATPPTLGNRAFHCGDAHGNEWIHPDLNINVPDASRDAYRSAWPTYAVYINPAPSNKITKTLDFSNVSGDVKCTDSDVGTKITGHTQHTHADSDPCWSWNNSTSTLTLNNARIDFSPIANSTADTGIKFGENGGKIVLKGSNQVRSGNASGDKSHAIYSTGSLEISGDGDLEATARFIAYYGTGSVTSFGIYSDDSITISGGTVTATGGNIYSDYETKDNPKKSIGICGQNGISITGGTVTATGGSVATNVTNISSHGIYGNTIELSGGTVTAKAKGTDSKPMGKEPTLSNGMEHKAGTGTWDNAEGIACVYEKFTPAPVYYTITFDATGGSVSSATAMTGADGKLTSLPTPTRSNHRFGGWFTAVSGGTAVTTGTVFTANDTIYAHWTYTGGSGRSSDDYDSGSSSDGSSNTTVTPPVPDKPNIPTKAEIKVKGKTDTNGNITVNVTVKNITDAIAKAEADAKKNGNTANGVTIVLSATGSKSAANVTVNLPKTVQDTIISKKVVSTIIVVDNPYVQIGMDLKAITAINKQAKSDVNITATKQDNGKLAGNAKTAIGSRPVFALKVNYGSGKQVQDFGAGSVSVSIPYTLGANENAGNVCAVYVDENGKVQWLTSSVYDSTAKVLRFSTNHFSTYGVGYKHDTPAFTDSANHWAKSDIEFVVSRGLFSGTSKTTFSPNTDMTRGMFVTALGRLANADVSDYKQSSFSDVKVDSYYMGYVEWANKNGIISGTGNGTFLPNASITREQMAVIMQNYAKVIGFTLPKVHEENTFADSSKISTYAKGAVKAIQMAGVLSGKGGNVFDPQGNASRAEVSAMLCRFVELCISIDTAQGWTMNDSGKWMYYENGKPVTGKKDIGGVSYTFDQNGETADVPKNLSYITHTVIKNESWGLIAHKYGCSATDLARVNNKTVFDVIHPGDVLKVPEIKK